MLREALSSAKSEVWRNFFSGSFLGVSLRRHMRQRSIMTRMTTARATDRQRTMMIPCRESSSLSCQPVGNDETSKSSKDGKDEVAGGLALSSSVEEERGQSPYKTEFSYVCSEVEANEVTHRTLRRAIKRPLSFIPVTVISQDVLVWQIDPLWITSGGGRWWWSGGGGCIGGRRRGRSLRRGRRGLVN